MENASKALIIAGAVLLSILIIAIGMAIYNGAAGSVKNAMSGMDSTEIAMFNQKFEQYEGSKKGSDVRSLITTIITENQANKENAGKLTKITTETTAKDTKNQSIAAGSIDPVGHMDTNAADLQELRSKIDPSRMYTIQLVYNSEAVISEIIIK